ncbi:MAG: cysteine hydrolase [Oscillospiraceae bacterium]|nr:cysteine hydrolase [Oscillospiraceae bacterium]
MVLLVVDTQKLITNDKLYMFDRFEENVIKLIKAARENFVEVMFVRHDDGVGEALTKGTEGFEIYGGFKPLCSEKIFDKTANSAFYQTGLLEYLKSIECKDIMVVGLQTDYCIDATVKCGFEHSFKMIVPEYCNSTFDNDFMSAEKSYKYYNEFIWKDRYADCVSIETALEMMKVRMK